MAEEKKPSLLAISVAPHFKSRDSIKLIMWMVVISLMPSTVYSVYIFGIKALILIAVAIVSAVISEALFQLAMKKAVTALDGSAVITGLLVAMNVPPEAPFWIVIVGSVFAVIIVKQLFGGLGFNIFNPALAARAFLMASWPVHMTTRWFKFSDGNVLSQGVKNITSVSDTAFSAITQATPLGLLKEGPKIIEEYGIGIDKIHDLLFSTKMLKSLFIGNVGGVIGETSALLLLIGGIFLLIRKIITWHIPVSFIGTVAVLMFLYYFVTGQPQPHVFTLFHLLSGGLFLGAFFMATDMVTSPVTNKGMILFGFGCGLITFVIRIWGGYPEGVSYSILLMNAFVPLIDRFIKPKVFGVRKNK
ncbi:RnfABCDGE type electron transport complex subunit D [Spirochaetota bacterium]